MIKVRVTHHAVARYKERIGPLPAHDGDAKKTIVAAVEACEPPPPGIMRKCPRAARYAAVGYLVVYNAALRAVFVIKEVNGCFLVLTVQRPRNKQVSYRQAIAAHKRAARRAYNVKGYERL